MCFLNRMNSTNLNDNWSLSLHIATTWWPMLLRYPSTEHNVCLLMWEFQCPNIAEWHNYYVADLVLGEQEITAQEKKQQRKEDIVCTYSKWQERRKQSSFIISRQFGQDSFQNGDELRTQKNTVIIFNNWTKVYKSALASEKAVELSALPKGWTMCPHTRGHGRWGWDVGAAWHVATSTASPGEEAGGPCSGTQCQACS